MPHIHLMILISAQWSATSLPCNILLHTQLYNLPLTISDISLLASNGTNCLNLFHPIRILVCTAASASPSTLNVSHEGIESSSARLLLTIPTLIWILCLHIGCYCPQPMSQFLLFLSSATHLLHTLDAVPRIRFMVETPLHSWKSFCQPGKRLEEWLDLGTVLRVCSGCCNKRSWDWLGHISHCSQVTLMLIW